jgi:FkbM family methyltransferase
LVLNTMQRWWRTRGTDIYTDVHVPFEFHGSDYGGWAIAADSLRADSVVLSFGIGEDITFDEAIIGKYSCTVHAFDPTPKALAYVEPFVSDKLKVYPWGLGAKDANRTFYLPRNPRYVSGSTSRSRHLRDEAVEVSLCSLDTTMRQTGVTRFDMLKMDIEGSEYEVLRDDNTMQILEEQRPQLLVEFHHRFASYSKADTQDIVARLRRAGFRVAWVSRRGEEVLFLPDKWIARRTT